MTRITQTRTVRFVRQDRVIIEPRQGNKPKLGKCCGKEPLTIGRRVKPRVIYSGIDLEVVSLCIVNHRVDIEFLLIKKADAVWYGLPVADCTISSHGK